MLSSPYQSLKVPLAIVSVSLRELTARDTSKSHKSPNFCYNRDNEFARLPRKGSNMAHGLGGVLKEIRLERGLTQGQVAYKADTAPEYISMLESGHRKSPSAQLLARISLALGTTPDYILTRAGILNSKERRPLEPEVQELDDILAAWPETTLKRNAREVIITVVETLSAIKGMDGEATLGEHCDETTNGEVLQ